MLNFYCFLIYSLVFFQMYVTINITEEDLKNNGKYVSVNQAVEEVLGDCFYGANVIVHNNEYYKIKNADHFNSAIYSITLKKLNKKEKENLL